MWACLFVGGVAVLLWSIEVWCSRDEEDEVTRSVQRWRVIRRNFERKG